MEVYVSGPGVTIAARGIGLERYTYWSGRSEMEENGSGTGKDLFDYSWNISGRNRMNVPDDVDFLKDKAWNDPENWVINACDYELADIWIEDDGVINRYRPHDISHVKHVLVKFKPQLRPKGMPLPGQQAAAPPLNHHTHRYFFYTGFSSEIGNWQHKQYNSSIPLEKFRLQIMEVSSRNWIVGLETTQEYSHAMSEEMCVNRLPVRNHIFLEDWMKATNLPLEYDMFTGNHKRDCSNFKIHNRYFWE
ncbi:uncharacterized protein METZ01_LOCUS309686 [marine metagenome]|uniref:Uncharacterized protein n=1 Tax=marine metagenome TaxID=408172 RepID=A0A382NAP1_9ZZZZ